MTAKSTPTVNADRYNSVSGREDLTQRGANTQLAARSMTTMAFGGPLVVHGNAPRNVVPTDE